MREFGATGCAESLLREEKRYYIPRDDVVEPRLRSALLLNVAHQARQSQPTQHKGKRNKELEVQNAQFHTTAAAKREQGIRNNSMRVNEQEEASTRTRAINSGPAAAQQPAVTVRSLSGTR